MPYKILYTVIEAGPTAPIEVEAALSHLAAQVEAAQADGWAVTGGAAFATRHLPHATNLMVMQSVDKAEAAKPAAPLGLKAVDDAPDKGKAEARKGK